MKAEFYINNTQIYVKDTFKFPFKVIKEVLTAGNVGGRSGIRSYSVELPVTRELLQALNINNYLDNKNKFYTTLQYDFKIIINSNVFFKGVFYLNSYDRFNIRGFFVSNNVDWSNSIAGKTLNDIQSLEPYDFKGMYTIIQNQTAQLLNTRTHNFQNDVCFPLIAYGTYFLPYWPYQTKYIDTTDYSGIVNNPAQLIDGFLITNSDIPHLSFEDIPPAYYIANILRAIFKDAGWAISGSWIGTINDLILPTCGIEKVSYNWGFLVDVQMISNVTFTQTNLLPDLTVPLIPPALTALGQNFLSRRIANAGSFTLIDTAFNSTNPFNFGDFYVPEDGVYELSINLIGRNRSSFAISTFPTWFLFALINPDVPNQNFLQLESTFILDLNGIHQVLEVDFPTPVNTWVNFNESLTFQTRLFKGQIIRCVSCFIDTLPIEIEFTTCNYSI